MSNEIFTFINNNGFAMVACVALFYDLRQARASHQEEMKAMSESVNTMAAAVNKMTDAVQRLEDVIRGK